MRRLFKNLRATTISSLSGLLTQAATAPLFLYLLGVDEFSIYILGATVGSFLTLTLNGFFFSRMNSITTFYRESQHQEASAVFTRSLGLIMVASVFGTVLAVSFLVTGIPSHVTVVSAFIAISATGFSFILSDAAYRAAGQFVKGTYTIAAWKLVDWFILIAALYSFREVSIALVSVAIYRMGSAAGLLLFAARRLPKLTIRRGSFSRRKLIADLNDSRTQIAIACGSALMASGPQLAISLSFPAPVAVLFNVTRTYMRLITFVQANVVNALWPIATDLASKSDYAGLHNLFMRTGRLVSVACGCLMLLLTALSPFVFPVLFGPELAVDAFILVAAAASAFAYVLTGAYQALFISANLHHRAGLYGLIIGIVTVFLTTVTASYVGFAGVVALFVVADVALAILTIGSVRLLLAQLVNSKARCSRAA